MLAQQLVNALSLGCVYALFALGFTLIFGVLGVINLSHGAVFMVGAYAAEQAVAHWALPLWTALLVAFGFAGAVGLLIDVLVLRPLRARGAPHLIPMIATIGVGMILTNVVQGVFGAQNIRFPAGLVSQRSLSLGGVDITALELGIIFLSFALMAVLLLALQKTQLGRALRAIAESPRAAWLLGINVEGLFMLTSFVAAGLGGVAGVLIGLYSNALYPLMGKSMLEKGIAVIILGGMGDMRGALIGGLFLGLAEVLSVAYVGSSMRDAVAFGLLFVILLVRPKGLFGRVMERKV
ncbi:MAG: branched-chain amino acid ABC transporter permease [Burkholderiales bacterium]|uniref:branched-chain amino acid ABC transporter permease n=1 Tax=Ottowia sp. TaxID=1898956 RepID=UPI001ACEA935|nr:branched-chain amino acid ABC transporter permease [Ottowia sp.]MBN9403998.1 branched-chain amino acid ABC transporter permease [Burkholderiales bacterium]MBS0401176.1 branched-chain amino acid ABC transporter permease [Pseudomonadota bacterium]